MSSMKCSKFKMDSNRPNKNVVCSQCSQLFFIRDPLNPRGPRCPLVLSCGHSACEPCVRMALQNGDGIICMLCGHKSSSRNHTGIIRKDFPLNVYLLGLFAARHNKNNESGDSKIVFMPAGTNTSLYKKTLGSSSVRKNELCCECGEKTAEWSCEQCAVLYCSTCFAKVHRAARALTKHKKCLIGSEDRSEPLIQPTCKEHPEQKLEFYCTECSSAICPYCVICQHQGHAVCTKKQKNVEDLEDMKDACDKSNYIMKLLLTTQKALRGIGMGPPASTASVQQVQRDIASYFVYLHGLLQRQEADLLQKLDDASSDCSRSLATVSLELDGHVEGLRRLLDLARIAQQPDNLSKVDLADLTKQLQDKQDLPCHLVIREKEIKDRQLIFTYEKSIFEELSDHYRLDIPPNDTYLLVSPSNLSPGMEVVFGEEESSGSQTLQPEDPLVHNMTASSRASSASALSDSPLSDSGSSMCLKLPGSYIPGPIKGTSEVVKVCHIKDPSSFYVQRESDKSALRNFCKQLKLHITNGAKIITNVLKDGLYLVQFQVDDNWYRARVRSIVPPLADSAEEMVDIVYVDYGNTEVVPISRLRGISAKHAHIPAFALHCSLFGLSPVQNRWSQEAIKTLVQMVNGSRVLMVVMEYIHNIYQVDLCKLPGQDSDTDVPISIRDALVFLELGCLHDETKPVTHMALNEKAYLKDETLKQTDIVDVLVSHVESPVSFYVQRLGAHAQYLTSVMRDMNTTYNNSSSKKGMIYTPKVGMPCAALYSVDKKWYRAKVIGIPGHKKVEVLYVDYGNQEIVHWTQLRKLHDRFLRIAAQAIHCSLSDVVPVKSSTWTVTANNFLIQVTAKKILRLYVDEVMRSQLRVTLYESQEVVDICLNGLLVRQGHAISIGVSSSLVEYHKQGIDIEPDIIAHKICKEGKKKFRLTGEKISTSIEKAMLIANDDYEESPFRLEVKVLSSASPSCMYVAIANLEEEIQQLMTDLQEYYDISESTMTNWKVNDKCCAFNSEDKLWYRAIIMELLDDMAKVFLKDFAAVVTVPTSQLQVLVSKFLQVRDGAVKCHLAGVKAAGDKAEWPSLACEFLTELVARQLPLYITKQGDIENLSLPVEMWVKEVIPGGPLDPTKEEWCTLNKKLVDQGLAIPVRNMVNSSSVSSLEMLAELKEQTQEQTQDPFGDWLSVSRKVNTLLIGALTDEMDEELLVGRATQVSKSVMIDLVASVENKDEDKGKDADDEDDDDEDEEKGEEGLASTLVLSNWLPPLPVTKTKFTAFPTYVDDNCNVYLHDSQSEDTLTVIQSALQTRFHNSTAKPHDLYWFTGQVCIAQYHHDKKWYRGKVVEVNNDHTVKVCFVDYGNIEDCKATEMRKNVYMANIPVQCQKCRLHGIVPVSDDEKWPTNILDFVHTTIVDKKCHATVKQGIQLDGDQTLPISLTGPGNIDIADLLVNMQYALFKLDTPPYEDSDKESVIIEGPKEEPASLSSDREMKTECMEECLLWTDDIEEQDESIPEDKPAYQLLPLPECDTIAVEVTAIVTSTQFVIHPWKMEGSELFKMKEEFEILTSLLQDEAPKQPLLCNPHVGQLCCACYAEDGLWYRGSVLALESKPNSVPLLKVKYVDYGNVECLPLTRVHELKPEWTRVPVQGLACQLWQVEEASNAESPQVLTKLMECLFQPPLIARIKERTPVLAVEFYLSDNQSLAYQSLLESGLLVEKDVETK